MNTDNKRIIAWGALLASLAVILGALGAHTLRETYQLEQRSLDVFETGVRYQFYHALSLIIVGILAHTTELNLKWVNNLFIIGIVIFCISLYFLAIRSLLGLEHMGWVGAITPLGGLSFIAGWLLLAFKFFKK